ncbi:hypothetical protein QFZ36_002313 [Pseudarthrobacter siccitolerans]|uniref:Transposase n=1 Tax=Pseudarthrobacter siccitolerans TaxID=861266 RepID=A0ABU0PM14_9MICC|nr:hypothetical protein [Pseudarthrobacter siccitolerans]
MLDGTALLAEALAAPRIPPASCSFNLLREPARRCITALEVLLTAHNVVAGLGAFAPKKSLLKVTARQFQYLSREFNERSVIPAWVSCPNA